MSLDMLVAHCEHEGRLHYRTLEKEGDKAYCCLEARNCPYIHVIKNTYYCTNTKQLNREEK